jgi:predicted TIM-barrel fold metal-dependent hydrolase
VTARRGMNPHFERISFYSLTPSRGFRSSSLSPSNDLTPSNPPTGRNGQKRTSSDKFRQNLSPPICYWGQKLAETFKFLETLGKSLLVVLRGRSTHTSFTPPGLLLHPLNGIQIMLSPLASTHPYLPRILPHHSCYPAGVTSSQ